MNSLIELLAYPFIQRAILAGIISGALLAFLGIFVVLRRMSFFSDGIAHASLAGVAAGILLSQQPLIWAIIVGVIFATAVYLLERKTSVPVDALIGILFTSSLALGVILMNFKAGYQPDLLSFLFGNILTIQTGDVALIIGVAIFLGIFMIINYKKYLLASLSRDLAYMEGMNVAKYELFFYIALAVAIVLGIKMVGVILVSALIIIPVSIGKLFASSSHSLAFFSIVIVELIIVIGMLVSLAFNLPTGATIVVIGAVLFFVGVPVSMVKIGK